MIVRCPNCDKKNRIPAARVDQMAKCGNCGEQITATGQPVAINPEAFRDLVDHSPLPVFVDFWAPWCGPCKMVAPEVEKLAKRLDGKVVVAKLDTQKHPAIAQQEGVRGIPMFALYRGGERVSSQAGYMSAEQLAESFDLGG
jgi:thioredoxin 2